MLKIIQQEGQGFDEGGFAGVVGTHQEGDGSQLYHGEILEFLEIFKSYFHINLFSANITIF